MVQYWYKRGCRHWLQVPEPSNEAEEETDQWRGGRRGGMPKVIFIVNSVGVGEKAKREKGWKMFENHFRANPDATLFQQHPNHRYGQPTPIIIKILFQSLRVILFLFSSSDAKLRYGSSINDVTHHLNSQPPLLRQVLQLRVLLFSWNPLNPLDVNFLLKELLRAFLIK